MTVIRFPLMSGSNYVEISEARQERISAALRRATAEETVDAKAIREAITEMGPWDRLTDCLLHDEGKHKILEAILTLALAAHPVARLRAQEAFLCQIAPHGLRSILADPRPVPGGYRFLPDTDSDDMKALLTMTLPYEMAGKFQERAGMFEHAALAVQNAADDALNDRDFPKALELLDKEADLWSKAREGFRAQEARRLKAMVLHEIADQAEVRHPTKAAEIFENEAKAWGTAFDFEREAAAWRLAHRSWLDAKENEDDEDTAAAFLEKAEAAKNSHDIATRNNDRLKHINERSIARMRILDFGLLQMV